MTMKMKLFPSLSLCFWVKTKENQEKYAIGGFGNDTDHDPCHTLLKSANRRLSHLSTVYIPSSKISKFPTPFTPKNPNYKTPKSLIVFHRSNRSEFPFRETNTFHIFKRVP
jgi:hypothetical protein